MAFCLTAIYACVIMALNRKVIIVEQQLKALRKKLGLTQEEFAARLGIKRAAISNYEIGRNEPIDAVISLICREFNVSEIWLHTGEGEMFVPKEADALDELAKQYGLSGGDYVLVEKFLKLKPSERQAVIAYMQDVVSALNEGDYAPRPRHNRSRSCTAGHCGGAG